MVLTKKYLFFLVLLCAISISGSAQIPDSIPIRIGTDTLLTSPETTTQPTQPDQAIIDTTRATSQPSRRPPIKKKKQSKAIVSNDVFYFYPEQPEAIYQFSDSLIDSRFFQYDPARSGERDFATLGAVGGPMLPLYYQWKDKYGSRAGLEEVFAPYIKSESEVKFYTKSKAFSDFFYSQGAEQNDHVFHGDFGRSFDNGIKLSVSHNRIIHSLNNPNLPLNGNALFPYPATRNTSLITGLAFQKPNSKYQGFLTYAHNEINQLYNGGILNTNPDLPIAIIDEIIKNADTLNIGVSIPSALNVQSANLRYRLRSVALNQFFTLAGTKDSVALAQRVFKINHKIKYTSDLYRFSDTQFNGLYYGDLATDERGLRVVLNQKILENYFGLSTLKIKDGKEVPSPLGDIRVGLSHQYAQFDGEGYETTFNNLFLEGAWKIKPISQLSLDVFGQLGVLENIGDFRLNAKAELALGKWGTLQGLIRQQRFSPSQYEQQNFVTQVSVWDNDFDKSFNSELAFKYSLPKHQLEAGVSYFLLGNHIFYNDQLQAQQRDGAINLVQFYLKKNLNWNIFHLENLVMIQSSTDEVIRLPQWWSRHSLYAQRRIFRKIMLARFGFDLRLNAPYFANNFNPALGQFYNQSEREVDLYPAVDAHFGFVIETFRIFLKIENFGSLWTKDIFYQVPFYPQKELAFRFGFSWRFLDKNSNKRKSDTNANDSGSSGRPSGGNRPNLPRF